MRTILNAVVAGHGDATRRQAARPACELVRDIRPVVAWLTGSDAELLRQRLDRIKAVDGGVYPLLRALIQAKLEDCIRIGPDEAGPDLATSGSKVVYSMNGLPPETRTLSHRSQPETGDFGLPILTLLGATLLGMKAGQRAPALLADGTTAIVRLIEVGWQPEAHRRLRSGGVT